ncbi:MAG: hypothetical protein ISS82_04360 [Nanoarchaeota archaeon]|nr:hypothetical protein [Nanoarchaeota archaeon]
MKSEALEDLLIILKGIEGLITKKSGLIVGVEFSEDNIHKYIEKFEDERISQKILNNFLINEIYPLQIGLLDDIGDHDGDGYKEIMWFDTFKEKIKNLDGKYNDLRVRVDKNNLNGIYLTVLKEVIEDYKKMHDDVMGRLKRNAKNNGVKYLIKFARG